MPYVDNVLTERLKSQSIVDFSLTQALFDNLEQSLSKDLISANDRLHGLMSKADILKALLDEIFDDHDADRVNLYICCFLTLGISLISLTVVGLMWYSVNPQFRSNQGVSISHPLSTTSFSFAERMEPSPSGLKALASLH